MPKTTDNSETWDEFDLDNTALETLLDNPLRDSDTSKLRDGTQHEGFDNNMGEYWIYPNNLPCRSYQMSIVQAALYRNTLVVLPTGLGKTFIAAVVMYNFYRWYPRGKIIFMAPTRPLVNQQIEACQKIMPFPKRDTMELTGKLHRTKRHEMWKTKRVFFATPQVVQSDIFGGRPQAMDSIDDSSYPDIDQPKNTDFPFEHIKLIVVDEAHKAKGKYAYSEVTQALAANTKYFRVLALSATPGRTVDDVAEICRNLLISHIEVRWDTSIDVLPYVQKRTMDTVVVSMGDKIKEIREQLLIIVDPYLRQLTETGVLSGSLTNINRNFLLYEQKRYRDRSFHLGRHPQHSAISSNFAICISLYHALELLERHGLRVFLNNFEEDEDGKNKFVLQMNRQLNDLVENLKKEMGPNPFEFSAAPMTNGKIAEIPKDLDFGHPKFEKTRECLLKHFENNKESRAIVFCEYRESVMLIYRMLLQHVPLLRPRCFVGQGGTGSLRALTQKQQIQIMNDFRSGKSNILIATSIGEEGIDVGEVELIVCFDISTSNPTRFVQRIGRTGRNKTGHVIMMVTEGREQQLLREVLSNKDQVNKKLLKSSVVQQSLYKHAPRLVPTEFKPKCMQTFVKPPTEAEDSTSTKNKKVSNNKVNTPKKSAQDLRKFFQKKPKELDKEDLEFFENNTTTSQAKPGVQTQQNIVNKLGKMKDLFKDLQTPAATQTQRHLKNTQTIKDFFKDSKTKNKTTQILNSSQTSFKDFSNSTIDLCDDNDDIEKNSTDIVNNKQLSPIKINEERLQKLKKLLKTTITTKKVLNRAKISDLGFHLKSKELSREMKTLLLKIRPEYIQENIERMQILNALCEPDTASYSEEEKSIKEINNIILELFGGLENVEKFLDNLELEKYKQTCLDSDAESDEETPREMEHFGKKLDKVFEGYGDGTKHDNYDWLQQRFKETRFYKDKIKSKLQNNIQESMVYETFAMPEDTDTFNNFDDFSVTESNYCSQWQEFHKRDIAFKSTPVQETIKVKRVDNFKRTSLLSKLEESKEDHVTAENKSDTSANSNQIQNMLLMLEHKLKKSPKNTTTTTSAKDDLEELENIFNAKRKDYEMRKFETESKTSLTNNFEDFNDDDDDELIMAAEAAELTFTQNHSKDNKHEVKNTPEIKNVTKEDLNVSTKLTSRSINSTPELDLSSSHVQKSEKSLAELDLQNELDIDMEAFLDPFPEEQELLKNNKFSAVRESLAKTTSSVVRESPDLFAEEHVRSPIKKPIVLKKPSLASKLSAKLNVQKCQSSINPIPSPAISPKPVFATQSPNEMSPTSRLATDKHKYEKSPSLFDMYMKSTKGKGKLPKTLSNNSILTSSVNISHNINEQCENLSTLSASQQNESLIVIRRTGLASKRKIFDSDSEQEDDKKQSTNLSDDTDFEEVAPTQKHSESHFIRQRRKRRRFNSFINQEAGVSGSDHSDDEADHTINGYVCDSLLAASDEDDPDQASTSHMQAMYLQSLKSPQQRRGTFKIPLPRVYNDHSRIFSQAVLPEDICSQYMLNSFIVDEDNLGNNNGDVSLCPLERAEKILEERRKAKKNCGKKKPSKTKTKIQIIAESSEDDDFE